MPYISSWYFEGGKHIHVVDGTSVLLFDLAQVLKRRGDEDATLVGQMIRDIQAYVRRDGVFVIDLGIPIVPQARHQNPLRYFATSFSHAIALLGCKDWSRLSKSAGLRRRLSEIKYQIETAKK